MADAEDKSRPAMPKWLSSVDLVRLAIPLGVALITGLFVALGIQGDILARLIRNAPIVVISAMLCAVAGVTLPLLSLKFKHAEWVAILGALFLMAGTVIALVGGVRGQGLREQPTVKFEQQGEVKADSVATYRITASALSLSSKDRLLLRVIALRGAQSDEAVNRQCRGLSLLTSNEAESRVLAWAENGASAVGTATSAATISIDRDEFRLLCAYAVLTKSNNPENDRRAVSLIDLRNAVTAPLPTPTPTPTNVP